MKKEFNNNSNRPKFYNGEIKTQFQFLVFPKIPHNPLLLCPVKTNIFIVQLNVKNTRLVKIIDSMFVLPGDICIFKKDNNVNYIY